MCNRTIQWMRTIFRFWFFADYNFLNVIKCCILWCKKYIYCVRFEVFMAVTMKNGVFWDVTPCGSCKDRRFGGT
jgi:hypothetical protein